MKKLGSGLAALLLAASSCSEDSGDGAPNFASSDEQASAPVETRPSLADQLIDGLGGQSALDAVARLRVTASGVRSVPYAGLHPDDAAAQANSFERVVSIDLEADALRVDTEREIMFGIVGPQRYADVLQGNLGASTQPLFGTPLGALSSDKVASIRRQELLLTPHLWLREFAPAEWIAGEDVRLDGVSHHTLVASATPAPLTLFIDVASGWVSKLETREHDFFQRDVQVEIFFSDWAPAGDTAFPRSVRVVRGGHEIFAQQASLVEINPDFEPDTFEFPGGVAPAFDEALYARGELSHQWYYLLDSIGFPFSGVDTSITPVDVAPNVLQLVGGSHHSFVVRQEAGLILVDAPLYEDRGDALVTFLEGEFPGVPITHIVASHFHEDHVAGVREVLGRTEATLVVQESSAAFWRELLRASSTLRPDALAASPRDVTLLTVPNAGQVTLEDATHPVTLYHLATPHAADMLLPHDTTSNSIFVVDIYNTGNDGVQAGAVDVDAALTAYAIPTADLRIVGGHGDGIDDYAALQASLAP